MYKNNSLTQITLKNKAINFRSLINMPIPIRNKCTINVFIWTLIIFLILYDQHSSVKHCTSWCVLGSLIAGRNCSLDLWGHQQDCCKSYCLVLNPWALKHSQRAVFNGCQAIVDPFQLNSFFTTVTLSLYSWELVYYQFKIILHHNTIFRLLLSFTE